MEQRKNVNCLLSSDKTCVSHLPSPIFTVIFLLEYIWRSSLTHDCSPAKASKTISLIKSDHINCHDSVFLLHICEISILGRIVTLPMAMIPRLSRERNAPVLGTSHGIDGCSYLIPYLESSRLAKSDPHPFLSRVYQKSSAY